MKQMIVNFDNIEAFSQFHALPKRYVYKDVEYIIDTTPHAVSELSYVDNKPILPYDVSFIFRLNDADIPVSVNKHYKQIALNRFDKLVQHCMLSELTKKSPEDYLHLPATSLVLGGSKPLFSLPKINKQLNPYRKLIIRNVTTARGMGIMKIPADSTTFNYEGFFRKLNAARKAARTVSEGEQAEQLTFKSACELYGADYSDGDENYDGEANFALCSGSFIITPELPFTFKEYRVITGGSVENTLVFLRNHNAEETQLAERLAHVISKSILATLVELQPHGSFDIWTNSDGWGVFEFQPQYGYEDINPSLHTPFLMETLHLLIAEYMDKENG